MRKKKTAPRTRKHPKTSSSQKRGLIAREKNPTQSAGTKSALDNHFHRTITFIERTRPSPAGDSSRIAQHAERCKELVSEQTQCIPLKRQRLSGAWAC